MVTRKNCPGRTMILCMNGKKMMTKKSPPKNEKTMACLILEIWKKKPKWIFGILNKNYCKRYHHLSLLFRRHHFDFFRVACPIHSSKTQITHIFTHILFLLKICFRLVSDFVESEYVGGKTSRRLMLCINKQNSLKISEF